MFELSQRPIIFASILNEKEESYSLDTIKEQDEIDYINAHATSTPVGDLNEAQALFNVFGSRPPVNATKSMTGHLLGAAGGIEGIFTALAIYHQISPPTINIFNQDEACDLDYCANQAREMKIEAALSNSFGFGGTNATLAFKRI